MYGPGECKSKLQDERRVGKNEFQPILDRCCQMSPNVAVSTFVDLERRCQLRDAFLRRRDSFAGSTAPY